MRASDLFIYTGASALWAMAVLGAIGLANWLGLAQQETILLVVAVAIIAVFGTFLPAVQLGLLRSRESRDKTNERHPDGNDE